jgi:hypothetical protein
MIIAMVYQAWSRLMHFLGGSSNIHGILGGSRRSEPGGIRVSIVNAISTRKAQRGTAAGLPGNSRNILDAENTIVSVSRDMGLSKRLIETYSTLHSPGSSATGLS